jgi:hypothetical protein
MARGIRIIRPDEGKAHRAAGESVQSDRQGLRLVESPYSPQERERAAVGGMRADLRKHIEHREEWRIRLGVTLRPKPTEAEKWASGAVSSHKRRNCKTYQH